MTEYIDREVAEKTKYKSIKEGWERNYFGIVRSGNVFWIEGHQCPDKTYRLAIKETKRLFPNLSYLYDVTP